MIENFHFLRPWWLVALLVPIAILWLSSRASDIRDRWKSMIAPHLLESLIVKPARASRIRPSWVLSAVLALSALAAAGPTWEREAPPFVEDTAPLVIAVDLSATMDAIDITPSRLERAKLKIKDVVAARPGGRTALVAYAGSAHQVLPLTDDSGLLATYGDALATRIMPVAGKNTANALAVASKTFANEEAAGTILFLTDGVEDAASAAFKAEKDQNLLVLGIGTAEGGPVKTPDGSFLTNAAGARVFAKLDIDALKKLGRDTGVEVATSTADDTDVTWVIQHVATNFAARKTEEGDRWKDAGWLLLFPIALLFALSFRGGWVVRTGALLLAARLVLLPAQSEAAGLAGMWLTPDQQGRLAFERSEYTAAAADFRDPMWRGTALYRAGKYAEAIDAFAAVDTPESWFNQGNALMRLGKFEPAVAAYNKALEARKDWPDATANLALAEGLLAAQKQDQDEQPQDPNEKPDQIQFDDKGKQGKAGEVDIAEQTSEMWMKNIQVSPAGLMARKFALEVGDKKP
ncbi:VWA domain-containing protein [Rhizobium sp. S152]|uniref:VWA domain-containing protein n=1 Tax=Rhizobium sp. S152 TaxID=3055038 RepID=UPI0025AA19A4|nr:VWA domain-containing protein [Rhizobium sp. S152]MDM9627484.1 VWA domain-containing protein [Rhizobium sp. S152]